MNAAQRRKLVRSGPKPGDRVIFPHPVLNEVLRGVVSPHQRIAGLLSRRIDVMYKGKPSFFVVPVVKLMVENG